MASDYNINTPALFVNTSAPSVTTSYSVNDATSSTNNLIWNWTVVPTTGQLQFDNVGTTLSSSPVSGPVVQYFSTRLSTSDATTHTIVTIPTVTDGVYHVTAVITAKNAASGVTASATYEIRQSWINEAGTLVANAGALMSMNFNTTSIGTFGSNAVFSTAGTSIEVQVIGTGSTAVWGAFVTVVSA